MLKLGPKSENASRWDRALYFDGCVVGWDSAAKSPSHRATRTQTSSHPSPTNTGP